MEELKNNNNIVIKRADKGSTVVVMDKSDYIAEANRQLSDSNFYRKLDHDPTKKHARSITTTLSAMCENGEISSDVYSSLCPTDSRPGTFYLLPKIHKVGNPGRPIVSAIKHPTEMISKYLDHHLQPFVASLPSYIKDTTDYINKTPKTNLPPGTLLVTMDVTSLYTNIPHSEGIEACRKVWESRSDKSPPTESLISLLEHVLKLNNFTFNNESFLQINGTSMGTKMAPSYANVFMGELEKKLLASAPHQPLSWLRFIDDIEMKWTNTRDNLDNFILHVNSFHPTIKFTFEISETTNVFLDTVSTLADGNIQFDLHTKPTDAHLYLPPSSCHPPHIFKGIPKGLATRVRRICSTPNTLDKRLKELKSHLCRRGYQEDKIDQTVRNITNTDRTELLRYKCKTQSNRVPFVVTYHPNLSDLSAIVLKHYNTFATNKRLKHVLPDPPMVSFRRPRNLKDHLVHSNLDNPLPNGAFRKCQNLRCKLCPHTSETEKFTSTVTGKSYKILQELTCKSKNVIYLITCGKCKVQYVGETEDPLNIRTNNHRSSITTKKLHLPVGKHFNENAHTWEDMEVIPIDHKPSWTTEQRQAKESFWQMQLKTIEPRGLNKSQDSYRMVLK